MAVTKSEHGLSSTNESLAVTGTFFQETQPVSAASLPLPNGASTLAAQGQFRDTAGTLTGWKTADGKPRVSSSPYLFDIAEGNVAGHNGYFVSGYNSALSSTEQTIGGTGQMYVFPVVPMQMEIVSSNAADTSNGTGARKIVISYLKGDFTAAVEEITLNGTTPVLTTATDIFRVNKMIVTSFGTGNKNAGNVDLRHITDTPIYSRMTAGINISRDAVFTTPKGYAIYVLSVSVAAASTASQARPVTFNLYTDFNPALGTTTAAIYSMTTAICQAGSVIIELPCPQRVVAGSSLMVSAVSPEGAAYGTARILGWIEPA